MGACIAAGAAQWYIEHLPTKYPPIAPTSKSTSAPNTFRPPPQQQQQPWPCDFGPQQSASESGFPWFSGFSIDRSFRRKPGSFAGSETIALD
jgi:hypothetical protein